MHSTSLPHFCEGFILKRSAFRPAYQKLLDEGTLWHRVERARELLRQCRVCPRYCDVNRLNDELGTCATGRYALVASAFPHHGEEDCLRGWHGSGTIFFARCNLKCVFCQNFDISRMAEHSHPMDAHEIAVLMLRLQKMGCHNINFVTPEHVVPQVIEAIAIAAEWGLNLPIVYNTSAYDSEACLDLLDGIIDIYMPDFKCWDSAWAARYLKAGDYPDVARQSIMKMFRQVGHLCFDESGLALRGVLIRHLVMPGRLEDTRKILTWIVENLGKDTYVNIMDQYHPAGLVSNKRYPELNRPVRWQEYKEAVAYAKSIGLWRLDYRWRGYS